jgi:hypothetical protein
LFLARLRDPVEFGSAIIRRYTPVRRNGALLFEFEKDWVESAVIDREQVIAGLLNAARDAISVLRAHGMQGFEDHESQRALPDFRLCAHIGFPDEYDRLLVGKQ